MSAPNGSKFTFTSREDDKLITALAAHPAIYDSNMSSHEKIQSFAILWIQITSASM